MAERFVTGASGVALFEDGRKLSVRDRKTSGLYTGGFVCLLVALIPGGFGGVMLVMHLVGRSVPLVVGLLGLAVALVGAAAFWRVVKAVKRRNALPPENLALLFVLDFQSNQLREADGLIVAPLHAVSVRRKAQLGSSSRALELRWEEGSAILVRGNPFAGGLGSIEDELRQRLGR